MMKKAAFQTTVTRDIELYAYEISRDLSMEHIDYSQWHCDVLEMLGLLGVSA